GLARRALAELAHERLEAGHHGRDVFRSRRDVRDPLGPANGLTDEVLGAAISTLAELFVDDEVLDLDEHVLIKAAEVAEVLQEGDEALLSATADLGVLDRK